MHGINIMYREDHNWDISEYSPVRLAGSHDPIDHTMIMYARHALMIYPRTETRPGHAYTQ